MLFNSLHFLYFFIIVFSLYLIFPHRWQNYLLIAASLFFYAVWNWKFLFVMGFSISVDYFCAQKIYALKDQKAKKLFLCLSIGVNLAILGFFKYFNFFLSNIEELLRSFHIIHAAWGPFKILLPLGISFYTFEAMSYVIDVYRGVAKPAQKYSDYFLFVIYFPHLIAGPIMRASNFLPQVANKRILSWELFYQGCFLFFWGLFEKIFIADNLGKIVDPIFAKPGPYEGSEILLALYAFAFQIFCDFDGYSNMARGLGLCMGFDISINFKWPYFASNPREYWQRWHITLSSWLRDYLYTPLSRNWEGKTGIFLALSLTMLLGGLWHGASWTFVLWGAYHGAWLIIHTFFRKFQVVKSHLRQVLGLNHMFKIFISFHLWVFGLLLFRARTFPQIHQMAHDLFLNFHFSSNFTSLWFILPLLAAQIFQYKTNDLMVLFKLPWVLKTFIYALMTYWILGWGVMNAEEFIYFQF